MHIGQAEISTLKAVGQASVVEPTQMQDRGLQVVNVDGIAGDSPGDLIRLADQIAGLPQGAIRSDKETMVRNVGRTYEEQLRTEAEMALSMFMRRDPHAIGARAFKEGRAPEWPHHGL